MKLIWGALRSDRKCRLLLILIQIKFTGLRPGEKLYEELLIGDNPVGTDHPLIWRALETFTPKKQLEQALSDLEAAMNANDCERVRKQLKQLVTEYAPNSDIVDKVWCALSLVDLNDKVTAIR